MNLHISLSISVFLLSSLLAYALIPKLIRLAMRKGYTVRPRDREIDIPKAIRKASHNYSIPLTGGLAIVLPFTLIGLSALLFFPQLFDGSWSMGRFAALLISASVVAALGLMDDIHRLSYLLRFLVTIPLMALLLFLTVKGQVFYLPGGYTHTIGYPELILLLFWCLGLSNAINLIDGLDGSAAGIIVIASIWLGLITTTDAFLVTLVLTAIIAACIAFLAYNFHPAKIFMGSTGTLFLGFVLAILTIWPPTRETPNYFFPYAILIFAVPLADMLLVFVVRLWHGRNPFVAASWHIHDRVLLTGVGRKKASVMIWSLSFFCGMAAYLGFREVVPFLLAAAVCVALLAAFYAWTAFKQKV